MYVYVPVIVGDKILIFFYSNRQLICGQNLILIRRIYFLDFIALSEKYALKITIVKNSIAISNTIVYTFSHYEITSCR